MKHEQNRSLTRTGSGEHMGALLRRYWSPVLLASELPENDYPQVRVKMFSERLLGPPLGAISAFSTVAARLHRLTERSPIRLTSI